MSSLLIFGAGGHGKVVADTAKSSGYWSNIAFADDLYPEIDNVIGIPVVADFSQGKLMFKDYPNAIVAIGDNVRRFELVNELKSLGFKLATVIHPSAIIAESVEIADACVVFANSVLQTSARLGCATIVNTSASVDHDCNIGNAVHIAPGTHVGGDVSIGDFSLLGIGSSVLRGVTVGSHSVIGAGAAVIDDIDDNSIAVGVPATVIRKT